LNFGTALKHAAIGPNLEAIRISPGRLWFCLGLMTLSSDNSDLVLQTGELQLQNASRKAAAVHFLLHVGATGTIGAIQRLDS
jgi:hypothetical protein